MVQTDLGPKSVISSAEVELPIEKYVLGAQERTNDQIDRFLPGVDDEFREMYAYSLDPAKASRTRSVLAFVAADTLGVSRDKVDELALATELIHNASLILDDLPSQDNSTTRRGKDVFWMNFGEANAELASLAMQYSAIDIVAKIDGENNLESALTRFFTGSLGPSGMCKGQKQDLETFEADPGSVTLEHLDQIAHGKTSKAIALGVIGVAILCKVGPEVLEVLEEYCHHTGIAYQVLDDIADATKPVEETGKTAKLDEEHRKPTYIKLLSEKGARKKAQAHADKALDAIERLPRQYNPRKLQEIVALVSAR